MIAVALRDAGMALADVIALARAADDAKYESIWLPEPGSGDAISLAAVIGSHTHRARVGTAVVPVYSRNPVALAAACATAARATDGRFILGLGAGHRSTAEAWFGSGFEHPRRRLQDTISILQRVFAGERVSHDGELHIDGFHIEPRPPRVPIFVGAATPATLRMAGRIADGVILNWLTREGMERAGLLAREAAADAGRRIPVLGMVRVAVADDPDQLDAARKAMRDETFLSLCMPAFSSGLRQLGMGEAVAAAAGGDDRALDVLVDTLCVFGEADTVRSEIASAAEAVDSLVICPVPYGDAPAESALRAIRALAP